MKRVLIVIDMQEDFVRGSLGSKDAEAIVSKVKAKITEYMGVAIRSSSLEIHTEKIIWKHWKVRICQLNIVSMAQKDGELFQS